MVSLVVQARVFREAARYGGDALRLQERSAGKLIRRPELLQRVADGRESVLEAQAGGFANGFVPVQEGDAMPGDAPVEAGAEVRHVEGGADAAHGQVAGPVVIGGIVALRAIAPAPEVALVAGGKADAVILQEISAAAPSMQG